MLWWVKNAPLRVPLVTTGDPKVGFNANLTNAVNTAGALGQPGTRVLLGGKGFEFAASSGARMAIGGWLDDDRRLGGEGSGFILGRQSSRFSATSDSIGSPPLYFPIFSSIASADRAIPIADPLRLFRGDVAVNSTLQLGGADFNAICTFYRTSNMEFAMLAGFRYAELRENLLIHNSTKDLLFNNVTVLDDSFQTSNQFYGGQIGGRLAYQQDWLSMSLTGKLAMGPAHQSVNIEGSVSQAGPNPVVPPGFGTFPGGLYAQKSNIGRRNANPVSVPFDVLPSLEFKLGYQMTQSIRATVGYDFMYWTNVLRPGNQIDHNVNLTQNAVLDPNGTGTLVGLSQPAPLYNRSGFYAQGISLGLELNY